MLHRNSIRGIVVLNCDNNLKQYVEFHPEARYYIIWALIRGLFIQEPQCKNSALVMIQENMDWYKKAMKNKGEAIICRSLYNLANTKKMVLTISQLTKDGSGVVAVNINLKYFQEYSK